MTSKFADLLVSCSSNKNKDRVTIEFSDDVLLFIRNGFMMHVVPTARPETLTPRSVNRPRPHMAQRSKFLTMKSIKL